MTDEEYERIKAEEKEHLRKMKELKEKARRLQRSQKTREAAEGVDRARGALDENSTLARRLEEETARNEARFELAFGESDASPSTEGTNAPEARAKELVRRLREEMNVGDEDDADPASNDTTDDRPDNTIGRMGRE
jgi:phage shock protein A